MEGTQGTQAQHLPRRKQVKRLLFLFTLLLPLDAIGQQNPRRYLPPNAPMEQQYEGPYAFLLAGWDYCNYGSAWLDLIKARAHPPVYEDLKKQAGRTPGLICSVSMNDQVVEVHPPNVSGYGVFGGVVIVFVEERLLVGPGATYFWVHVNSLHSHDPYTGEVVPFVPF